MSKHMYLIVSAALLLAPQLMMVSSGNSDYKREAQLECSTCGNTGYSARNQCSECDSKGCSECYSK